MDFPADHGLVVVVSRSTHDSQPLIDDGVHDRRGPGSALRGLTAFLVQRGSPESKPVTATHAHSGE
jgi:hypothetical protein